ncbi:MAG: hypothetical protein ACJ77V_13585 [Chloroflexota bacterium]
MSDEQEREPANWHPLVEPDESVIGQATARGVVLLATDKRMAVVDGDRMALDLPYHRLRRIQFDIERRRPATLVIVPESPADEPQVISIQPEEYRQVADVLVAVGRNLIETG